MAYISVEFAGQKSFGGYLRIDNGAQIQLFDGLIIPVETGTHYLSFSSQTAVQRNLTKANVALGNYRTALWAEKDSVDGSVTQSFDENDVLFLTVVSDDSGHILDAPEFTMREFSDEEMREADRLYAEQQNAIHEVVEDDKRSAVVELVLCLFLGCFGVHKFYAKQIGMGILYLLTMGLFGIGTLVDLVKIIMRMMRK